MVLGALELIVLFGGGIGENAQAIRSKAFFTHISPAIYPRIYTPISPAIRAYLAGELSAISPYFDMKLHAHFYP